VPRVPAVSIGARAVHGWNPAGYAQLLGVPYAETRQLPPRELAARLGDGRVVLLRGHGLLTVGEDVPEATVYAVLADRAARIHGLAARVGVPEEISSEDIELLDAHFERNRSRRIAAIWGYLSRLDASRAARR